ncbi:uncharacterized protein LOC143821643 isoform X1 [Paroedura picta]|uniref:uncharacterized protein LOC143821643 isoform X1 n=2 Tax=Paroedura picta TaxID=143630 RepID=UPI004055E8EB
MSIMKIQMNDILALCFLVMLSVGIDSDRTRCDGEQGCHEPRILSRRKRAPNRVKCLGCTDVGFDNNCKTKAYECTAGKWQFCYVQRFSRMRKTVKVQRGCTAYCKSESRIKNTYRFNTWCCFRELCNSMNVW